jgi:hypothetical protein
MRRVAVFLAFVSLFVFGFGFNVNAQAPRQPAQPNAIEQRISPASKKVTSELRRIRSLAPNVTLCSNITANSDVSKLIDCLNRVTRFAKATENQLNALDKFVNSYLNCTRYVQLTEYGDPLGSQGYVYDPGTGTTFKTTAMDFTNDVTTQPFLNFTVLKPTNSCVKFAN